MDLQMAKLISFEEAIQDSIQHCKKRHLILGNGFSIACCPDIFHYGSLFDQADFSKSPELIEVFKALGIYDFELAIRNLEASAKLIKIYAPKDSEVSKKMIQDA